MFIERPVLYVEAGGPLPLWAYSMFVHVVDGDHRAERNCTAIRHRCRVLRSIHRGTRCGIHPPQLSVFILTCAPNLLFEIDLQ